MLKAFILFCQLHRKNMLESIIPESSQSSIILFLLSDSRNDDCSSFSDEVILLLALFLWHIRKQILG